MRQSSFLTKITEKTKIEPKDDYAINTEDDGSITDLSLESIVSMNCFGFTPTYFKEINKYFVSFLQEHKDNLLKCEFYLPSAVQKMIDDNIADVKLVNTNAKWVGVTYHSDSDEFTNYIAQLREKGEYPEKLI